MAALFAAMGLVIFLRFAFLTLSPRDPVPKPRAAAERGPILDREGRLMAVASPQYHVAVWKPDLPWLRDSRSADAKEGVKELEELAAILGMPAQEAFDAVSQSKSDFFYLKKQIPEEAAKAVREGRGQGKFKGFLVEEHPGRTYPMGELACHAIGYVGDDDRGLGGIEYAFDAELTPVPAEGAREAFGDQVVLTIDAGVQAVLERVARETWIQNGAESIMFLASDPRSGEILGYAAFPGFDPAKVRDADPAVLLNLPSNYTYEPGSVFKVFTMAGLYQLDGINPGSVFLCDGAYHNEGPGHDPVTIKCMSVHGWVTPSKILSLSCNAGAGYASDSAPIQDFSDILVKFGFGSRTGSGFKGEEDGFLRPVQDWSLRSKPTIAMGQEVLVTAMQMVQAASAVANRGILMKPRIVSRVVSQAGKLVWENPPVSHRVLDEAKARDVIGWMETAVAQGGTGNRAHLADVRLAVKTGTAQMVTPGSRTYSATDFIASTLAILPAEDPSLVLYMAIVKPHGDSIHGGRIAAPAIAKAADELIEYLGLRRAGQEVVTHPAQVTIDQAPKAEIGETMPDLTGFPKRSLVPLLSRTDIAVSIRGEGRVARQSPAPGSPVPPGTVVVLELE
jgi:cell division protein FtsI (penicillin-binding protein 3)